jgi:hypothetical protein
VSASTPAGVEIVRGGPERLGMRPYLTSPTRHRLAP